MLVRSLADGEETPSPRLLGTLSPAGDSGTEVREEFIDGARIWRLTSLLLALHLSRLDWGRSADWAGPLRSGRGFWMNRMFSMGRVEPVACCCVR